MNASSNGGDLVGQWCRRVGMDDGPYFRIRAVALEQPTDKWSHSKFVLLLEGEQGGALFGRVAEDFVVCARPMPAEPAAPDVNAGQPFREASRHG